MRFSTSFLITLLSNLAIVLLDKGAGLVILWILKDAPAEKGSLDLLSTFPFILMAVSNLGLAASAIYFVRRGEASIREAGETTTLVAILWGGGLALLAVLVVHLYAMSLGTETPFGLLLPLALTTPFMLIVSYRNSLQLVLGRIHAYNLIHLIPSLAYLPAFLCVYYFLAERRSAVSVVWARFLPAVFLAFLIVWLLRREIPIRPAWHPRFFRKALAFGWKANLNSTLTYLNHRVDLYLVRLLYLPGTGLLLQGILTALVLGLPADGMALATEHVRAEVAFYSLAVTLAELIWYVPDALRDLLFTKVAGLDPDRARRFTPAVCRNTLWVCFAGAAVVWLVHDSFLGLLLGESWERTWAPRVSPALLYLLPGTLFFTVAKVLQADLAGRGRIKTCILLGGIVLASMTLFDLLWVPEHGAAGAALASSLAYGLSAVATLAAYIRNTGAGLCELLIPRREDLAEYRGILKRMFGIKEAFE